MKLLFFLLHVSSWRGSYLRYGDTQFINVFIWSYNTRVCAVSVFCSSGQNKSKLEAFQWRKRYIERLPAPSSFLHYWSIMPLSLAALSVSLEHSGHLGRAREQFMTHFWTHLKGDWVLESVVEEDGMPDAPLDCRGLAGAHASPASNGEQSGERRNLWTAMWQLVCPNWCENASLRGFFPAFSPHSCTHSPVNLCGYESTIKMSAQQWKQHNPVTAHFNIMAIVGQRVRAHVFHLPLIWLHSGILSLFH